MKKLLAVLILAAGTMFAQFSVGIHIGPMPRARVEHQSRRPNVRSIWIAGHWDVVNHRYVWHPGYWTEPPYEGARWIAPSHDGQMFHDGYWDGDKGRRDHDHHDSGKRH
jgi:hypothetical protein